MIDLDFDALRRHRAMLTSVTITGADDGVNPGDLVALSREFPFVEWGILFSAKRTGTPRYPTPGWVHGLAGAARRHGLRLSAHLCGQMARDTAAGLDRWLPSQTFQRAQINGIDVPAPGLAYLASEARWSGTEFIVQVRYEARLQHAAHFAAALPNVTALFDPSGGRGVEPLRWPAPPLGLRLGYAGGITPANVDEVLTAIAGERLTSSGDWWIDMESGVRTGDRFDLALVREVLDRAQPWIARKIALDGAP